ncbi:uncharacterized protein [Arachis hypogaea]|uniref:uncharacterized protein n=1 Tax=Arachis hypogaea TaxID=3818 RepID=UPI003B2175D3|nr:uncharacterized protein DS421_14g452710 [Arachis hypogaea]
MSWIYQRFPQWCPPDRGIYQYPLAARLVGLQQQSRDQHQARVLHGKVSIDRLRFDEVAVEIIPVFHHGGGLRETIMECSATLMVRWKDSPSWTLTLLILRI